jgi:hypothetical protein
MKRAELMVWDNASMHAYLDLVANDDCCTPVLPDEAKDAALNAAKRVFTVESVSPLLAYSEWRAKRARRPFNAKLASLYDAAQEASQLALAARGLPVPFGVRLIVLSR